MNRVIFAAGTLLMCARSFACEVSAFEQLATDSPYGVTIASAALVEEDPRHCSVEGMIANAENGQSRIRFRLNLPDPAKIEG